MKLATLCYIRQNNRTLMLHRIKKENDMHEGKWNGLGGKFEEWETPEECAIREIEEESGLKVKNPKLKAFLTFPAFDTIETWYVWLFVIDEFEGELIDSPEWVLEWIDDDKLLDLNLWEWDKVFLKCLDQDGLFSGKFIYEDYKLVDYAFERVL